MAFTSPTISHNFSGASGVIEYSLLTPMSNGTVTLLPPAIIAANLDASGNMTATVPSNLDPTTEPAVPWQSSWRVDIQVVGAQSQSYVIDVPPIQTETNGSIVSGALTTLQLSSLTPKQFMIGQSVVCSGNIPAGATVVGVNTANSTVTMSTAGTAGAILSVTFGTAIDLAYLLPTIPQPL